MRSGDELGGFYGRLAEGIAVTDDRETLVFRLHRGARFHDGEPVTADDVKFTLDWATSTVDGGLVLSWIDAVEVTGEREVRLHLNETLKDAHLRFLTAEPRILPEHHWRGRNPSPTTLVEPVGSGPYRIERWARDYIRRRVEDYWGRDLPVTRGLYSFDELHFDVYRDATVLRESLRKGLIDYYVENDVRHWASSYETPAAGDGSLRRGEVTSRVAAGMNTAIGLNSKRPHLDDVRVREALTVAFDFDWLNRALHAGIYQRAYSYFPNSAFGATGLPTPGEVALLKPLRAGIDPRVFPSPSTFPRQTGKATTGRHWQRRRPCSQRLTGRSPATVWSTRRANRSRSSSSPATSTSAGS